MLKEQVLLTGGAGYIGGHTIQELLKQGYEVIVVDNLSAGTEKVIPKSVILEKIDLLDKSALAQVFKKYNIKVVIHNAAKIDVRESMEKPLYYYENNVMATLNLLQVMSEYDCKNLVFASTAAVYGDIQKLPICEDMLTKPVNVYGKSKLMAEELIKEAQSLGIKSVIFRFFNVGGVDIKVGRAKAYAKNVIGKIVSVLAGEEDYLEIYGNDFNTVDGSPARDYIHVLDIARAEVKAVGYLLKGGESVVLNLSRNKKTTVKELIKVAEKATSLPCEYKEGPARVGDIAVSFASAKKAKNTLQWQAEYALIDIIKSEWQWYQKFTKIN